MNYKCPKCGSNKIAMEKSTNGYTSCQDCGRKEKHNTFYSITDVRLENISTEDLEQELKERKNKIPSILLPLERNYENLEKECMRIMLEYKKQGYSKDDKNYIYESALKCFYGEDVFDWVDNNIEDI